jgi:threonine/homoserine/homoserine lactone efflux protein
VLLYRDVASPLALVCGHNDKVTAMSLELIFAFILFAFVTSVTPGPNNMMLLASGVNFGVRRSVPHMLGISLGFMVLVMAVGLGLSQVFEQVPALYTLLRYGGAAYLLYLAWKIAGSGAPNEGNAEKRPKPFTFLQAAAFQWVNPKAWVMAIGAITTYTPQENFVVNVVLIAALFALINCPSVGLWTVAGSLLRRWLAEPRILRLFNIGMALLLVASLYPILVDVNGKI